MLSGAMKRVSAMRNSFDAKKRVAPILRLVFTARQRAHGVNANTAVSRAVVKILNFKPRYTHGADQFGCALLLSERTCSGK